MSDPLPPRDSIPALLQTGDLAKRPLYIWYAELVNLTNDQSARYTAFKLVTIFHWERSDNKFKHEGLTLAFKRDPCTVVYLRVDRMSFDNDPWHGSKVSSSGGPMSGPKSFRSTPKEAEDQEDGERKGRAADWCQPLEKDVIKKYFIASTTTSSAKNNSLRSLGMTHFQNADTRPNLIDVILAAYAVSMCRQDYHLWSANCWWLARSIRLFVRTEWGGEDDGDIPQGLLVDICDKDLVEDQSKISSMYKDFNAKREQNLNLHTAELRAQAAEEIAAREAEGRHVEEERRRLAEAEVAQEAEGRRVEAEGCCVEAEGRRVEEERRCVAEAEVAREAERRRTAEMQIAKLQEQLRLLTPDSAHI